MGSQETFGVHDGHYGLIEGREAAIPLALFRGERERERLQLRHAGHFLDAIDQQRGARLTQDKNQGAGCERQTEMDRAVDHKESLLATLQ